MPSQSGGGARGLRARFALFRRTRPFWAGVFAVIAGAEILIFPLTPISSLVQLGVGAISGVLIGLVLIVMGAFMWFSPPNRTLAGVLTILFSLASFLTSNLGGLVMGMVLGLVGGGLCLAWTPKGRPPRGRGPGGKGGRGRPQPETEPAATEESFDPQPAERPRPSPRPGPRRRLELRLRPAVVGVVTTVAVVIGSGLAAPGTAAADESGRSSAAAPAEDCLLGLFCSPTPPSASSTSPGGTSSTRSTSTSTSTPTPSARTNGSTATAAPAAPSGSAASPTPPTGVLGLPNPLPGVAGALSQAGSALPVPLPSLAPGRLPLLGGVLPNLITPLLPTVAPDPRIVVSGRIGKLTMDTLTVTNFRFLGVVTYPVAGGGTVKALRIVVDSTDIGQLGVVLPGPQASLLANQAAGAAHASSPVLILDVTRLSLKVFGVLPVEFSFAFPPPPLITIPALSGTDVDIDFVQVSSDLKAPAIVISLGPASTGPPSSAPASDASTPATLVSLASLLNLPGLLTPYGLSTAQAQQAMTAAKASPTATSPAATSPAAAAGAGSTAAPPTSSATPTPDPTSSTAPPSLLGGLAQ